MTMQPVGRIPTPRIGFGDRLRRIRLDAGMTQDEFGAAVGISGATVGKYEVQQRTPQLGQVIANSVQLRFGVPAEWLLTGAEAGPGPESTVSGFGSRVLELVRPAA